MTITIIFTLPHDLNPLWLANVSVMSALLFQAVRDTLTTLLADPKYRGAQPGIIAALHTGARPWCCIRTSIAWSQEAVSRLRGPGSPCPRLSLPMQVVMAVFRGRWWTRSDRPSRVGRWSC